MADEALTAMQRALALLEGQRRVQQRLEEQVRAATALNGELLAEIARLDAAVAGLSAKLDFPTVEAQRQLRVADLAAGAATFALEAAEGPWGEVEVWAFVKQRKPVEPALRLHLRGAESGVEAPVTVAASAVGEGTAVPFRRDSVSAQAELVCERSTDCGSLLAMLGSPLLFDRDVGAGAGLSLTVTLAAATEQRAFLLLPEFMAADGRVLAPPYPGPWAVSTEFPAYVYLPAAPEGAVSSLEIPLPAGAARLRLRVRPWQVRGVCALKAALAGSPPRPAPLLTVERTPDESGAVSLSVLLRASADDDAAAVLLPEYLDQNGRQLPAPYAGFAASNRFPAYRYLAAGPAGRTTHVTLFVPPEASLCRFMVVPWRVRHGLRGELCDPVEEAAAADGLVLGPHGVAIARDLLGEAQVGFVLRVWGRAAEADAANCLVGYRDREGSPLPTAEHTLRLVAGATADGQPNEIWLTPPASATRLDLTVLPCHGVADLRVRLEPVQESAS